VGAAGEEVGTGINGARRTTPLSRRTVYVFQRTGNGMAQQPISKATNTGANDGWIFRGSIRHLLAVGALGEASRATGTNGDQADQ